MRIEYGHPELLECDILDNPMDQFQQWFSDAVAEPNIGEPNAMTLATATKGGIPNARIVLLKAFDHSGFVWYTNYDSAKGKELAENPFAALLFYWHPLQRTVRVQGAVTKVSEGESDAYFKTRPCKSRIAAIVSAQSEAIPNKDALKGRFDQLLAEYGENSDIARPSYWGGYRLAPDVIEFWQGGPSRIHDRFRFTKARKNDCPETQEGWRKERLCP